MKSKSRARGPGYPHRTFAAVVWLMCFIPASGAFGMNEPLRMWLEPDRTIYRLKDQVIITVYLKNAGEEPISVIEPAVDRRSLYIEITYPDGKKDKLLSIYGMDLERIRLYPGKIIRFRTEFRPLMPGNYKISARYYGYGEEPAAAPPVSIFVVQPRSVSMPPEPALP